MEMKDMPVSELAALTASSAPAPGGGAISALTGAFGAALAQMVASLTLDKKGYEEVQEDMRELAGQAEVIRRELLDAIEKDRASFDAFMAAMALPKNSEEEKARRKDAMQQALKVAAQVPFATAQAAARVMPLARAAVEEGNRNLVTDGLAAAMLARSAVRSALLNVKINLDSIQDADYVATMRKQCQMLEGRVIAEEADILALAPALAYCKA